MNETPTKLDRLRAGQEVRIRNERAMDNFMADVDRAGLDVDVRRGRGGYHITLNEQEQTS